jgi:hypothetical protein
MAVSFAGQKVCRPQLKNTKAAGGISACGFGWFYGKTVTTAQADPYKNTRNKNRICLCCCNSFFESLC